MYLSIFFYLQELQSYFLFWRFVIYIILLFFHLVELKKLFILDFIKILCVFDKKSQKKILFYNYIIHN